MKNIVHLDVYPMVDDNHNISHQYPMHKLYDMAKRYGLKVCRLNLTTTFTKRDVKDCKEITPHVYCNEFFTFWEGVYNISAYVNVAELENPEFDSDVNVINKILRTYLPEFYKEGFEIITDYNCFHPRVVPTSIEAMLDIICNKNEKTSPGIIPFGQLTANFILLNMQQTGEKTHVIHFDPRSYYSNINCKPRSKTLTMYVPGNHANVHIYHPMDMRNKIKYYSRDGQIELTGSQYYHKYPLWLWDVDIFDITKKPKLNPELHMFVRLNRHLTEQSLNGYDNITHDLFMSGGVDHYHIFTSAENKDGWVQKNDEILRKISPGLHIDFKSIKDCGESGFSYVSLRSKKYPFMTPKFLELLRNGIVPLVNILTCETMSVRELFPTELYIKDVFEIEQRMKEFRDNPKLFDTVIDELWKRIEGQHQPLVDMLELTLDPS